MRLGVGEGGGVVKNSFSNLINYFSVSGESKQKKIPQKKWYFDHNLGGRGVGHFVVGITQKYHFFFGRRPKLYLIKQRGCFAHQQTTFFSSLSRHLKDVFSLFGSVYGQIGKLPHSLK